VATQREGIPPRRHTISMTESLDQLRGIVHTALMTPSPFAPYRPEPPRRAVHDDVMLVAIGPPDAGFREALVVGPSAPERVFALAEEFFGVGARYSVTVEVEAAQPMEAALRATGWRLDEEEPALVLTPLPPTVPAPPPDLDIRPVTDAAGLADFRAVTGSGEGIIPSLAAALDPSVCLLVGYRDGRPVATARFNVQGGSVADINGVVTVAEERRRGYGTALTWAAVAEARARGCTAAELTATEMGYPVYLKMGFVPVCTYRTYVPPDEPLAVSR
jgi:GNAT superfamily N-acetyltransferase